MLNVFVCGSFYPSSSMKKKLRNSLSLCGGLCILFPCHCKVRKGGRRGGGGHWPANLLQRVNFNVNDEQTRWRTVKWRRTSLLFSACVFSLYLWISARTMEGLWLLIARGRQQHTATPSSTFNTKQLKRYLRPFPGSFFVPGPRRSRPPAAVVSLFHRNVSVLNLDHFTRFPHVPSFIHC